MTVSVVLRSLCAEHCAAMLELLRRIPGEPLALDGSMKLMTTLNGNRALSGVRDWRWGM